DNPPLKQLHKPTLPQQYQKLFSPFSIKLPANQIPNLLPLDPLKPLYPHLTYKTHQLKNQTIHLPNQHLSPLI
ncbi:hypothetical protein, partial [Bacillus sp. WP8]|uniref:hypothetical protein n=1 Tax=Bacillus sp. WP8 TaxID=756828 RepID=UPI001C92FD95